MNEEVEAQRKVKTIPFEFRRRKTQRTIEGVSRPVYPVILSKKVSRQDNRILSGELTCDRSPDPELERSLQKTIHKVQADIDRLAFNTAIAAMMIFSNEVTKSEAVLTGDQARRFVQILSPFAPHLSEELWSRLGSEGRLAYSQWPDVDERMLVEETLELAVQVNGKVRARVSVGAEAAVEEVLNCARTAAAEHLQGKDIVKEVVVPGRLVNFVVK